MAATRPCLLWARHSRLQIAYQQRPLNLHRAYNRSLSTQKPVSPKPRPYWIPKTDPKPRTESKPLPSKTQPVASSGVSQVSDDVEALVRPRATGEAPPEQLVAQFRPKEGKPKVWFFYFRITFGLLLVGSIIYSMVSNLLRVHFKRLEPPTNKTYS